MSKGGWGIFEAKIRAKIIPLIMGKLYAWNITPLKKNYSQTGAGKRYFIKIYKQAVAKGDKRMVDSCRCIFECYDLHRIKGHIERPNGSHIKFTPEVRPEED